VHEGRDLSGKEFDTTWQSKRKEHKPLAFQLGANRVIRGWEECIKQMALGGVVSDGLYINIRSAGGRGASAEW